MALELYSCELLWRHGAGQDFHSLGSDSMTSCWAAAFRAGCEEAWEPGGRLVRWLDVHLMLCS